jgi:hypothetical protein
VYEYVEALHVAVDTQRRGEDNHLRRCLVTDNLGTNSFRPTSHPSFSLIATYQQEDRLCKAVGICLWGYSAVLWAW